MTVVAVATYMFTFSYFHLRVYEITMCIRFLIYEPQRYSGGVMRKRRGLPNAYD